MIQINSAVMAFWRGAFDSVTEESKSRRGRSCRCHPTLSNQVHHIVTSSHTVMPNVIIINNTIIVQHPHACLVSLALDLLEGYTRVHI